MLKQNIKREDTNNIDPKPLARDVIASNFFILHNKLGLLIIRLKERKDDIKQEHHIETSINSVPDRVIHLKETELDWQNNGDVDLRNKLKRQLCRALR